MVTTTIHMESLVNKLLDPRCANILAFLDWRLLSGSEAQEWMLPLLREHPERLDWSKVYLYYQPWMRRLINENPECMDWKQVIEWPNEHYRALLHDHPERLDWSYLCRHFKWWMLPLFQENTERLDYPALIERRWAMTDRKRFDTFLLSNTPMSTLCEHADTWMLEHFREHPNEVDWTVLSRNGFFLCGALGRRVS